MSKYNKPLTRKSDKGILITRGFKTLIGITKVVVDSGLKLTRIMP